MKNTERKKKKRNNNNKKKKKKSRVRAEGRRREKHREKKPEETYLRHDKVQSTALPPLCSPKKKTRLQHLAARGPTLPDNSAAPPRRGSARDPPPCPTARGSGDTVGGRGEGGGRLRRRCPKTLSRVGLEEGTPPPPRLGCGPAPHKGGGGRGDTLPSQRPSPWEGRGRARPRWGRGGGGEEEEEEREKRKGE